MNEEDKMLKEYQLAEQAHEEQLRMQEEANEQHELDIDEKWKKFMLETEIEKQNIIKQLMEASVLRNAKKDRKRRRPKGGKH